MDDYDVFLGNWEPGERLRYSILPQSIADPVVREQLLSDSSGEAPLERTAFSPGLKVMDGSESNTRLFTFFEDRQEKWAEEFRDYLLSRGITVAKIDVYNESFAQHWVDGRKRRQDSAEMLAIKASIRDHDLKFHRQTSGQFVINQMVSASTPLFTPDEMAIVFEANQGLIDAFLPDYIDILDATCYGTISDLHVRRGVCMPTIEQVRRELHYLSSYSLTLGPVEQFAQTYTPATRVGGVPSIFSAPLPAVQTRIVAFAPFVKDMDLSQLELVVAPPIASTQLQYDGEFGGIHEFSFK
ncbi:hypothetical protein [Komagataeibacter oboediens]|uniref:hypothetical protein n=1 Tax=Komagataeibacter oboediens TaxID=65958 RepID=UPI001C2D7B4B|nr:hypothetical protein [Komagataeibacter oboediens]MBV1825296.1 hypothetical protein [Komagataeibacter oboediens]